MLLNEINAESVELPEMIYYNYYPWDADDITRMLDTMDALEGKFREWREVLWQTRKDCCDHPSRSFKETWDGADYGWFCDVCNFQWEK